MTHGGKEPGLQCSKTQGLNPVLKLIIPEHPVGVAEWPLRSTTYVNNY